MLKYPDDFINKIIHGDCLEVMKQMPDKCVDLVLTDPPYGIGEDGGKFRDRRGGGHRVLDKMTWDKQRPSIEYFSEIRRIGKNQVVWGGNYFTDYLPPSKGWLYWQKLMGGDFSDGELAWTSYDKALKEFTLCNKYHGKMHPTEKPVKLFKWVLLKYTKENENVFDPFLGSGTTAIACKELGRNFIGIELEKKYVEIANERIRIYDQQLKLL